MLKASRQNCNPDSPHPSPFDVPEDSYRKDDEEDDRKPSAIATTTADDKINQILALTLSFEKDLLMNTNHLARIDSHLYGLDHRLDGINITFGEVNKTVNNLKLDVHALETAKEDNAKNANCCQAQSSTVRRLMLKQTDLISHTFLAWR